MQDVVAVIPTYQPDDRLAERVDAILAQGAAVIVVDDGSPAGHGPALDERDGLVVLGDEQNRGIAAALNRGVREALRRGASHILTLDQDSLIRPGYLERALEVYRTAPADARVGMVVPDLVDGRRDVRTRTLGGLRVVEEAIQSGAVISAACVREAGLFDERLVIDAVDTEFCLRIRTRGYLIAVADGTDLEHELGSVVPFRPFGLSLTRHGHPAVYQYHQPFRHYYVARNSVDLAFRYGRHYPRWTLRLLRREALLLATTVSAGPQRWRHFVAGTVGLWHGAARRRGPMPSALRAYLIGGERPRSVPGGH
ncbi:glycosyltransferase [Leifsonia sp. 2MCAF36]|uniref:glycosyltransferase n=1 Tax=Leifsonia sp. 2MCAF36 TaxID=3232988 RepID=UPI003F9B34C0